MLFLIFFLTESQFLSKIYLAKFKEGCVMEISIVQVQVDVDIKNEASQLFNNLGLDMSTAINIFLKKCLQEGGIPFDVKVKKSYKNNEGMRALLSLQQQAEKNGLSNMTLDEINAEIAASRAERRARKAI